MKPRKIDIGGGAPKHDRIADSGGKLASRQTVEAGAERV
jgi:hypothetical protein